jgi:hypothetical protein
MFLPLHTLIAFKVAKRALMTSSPVFWSHQLKRYTAMLGMRPAAIERGKMSFELRSITGRGRGAVVHEMTSAGSLLFSMLIELDPAGHHDAAGEDHHQGNIQQQIALFDQFFMHSQPFCHP